MEALFLLMILPVLFLLGDAFGSDDEEEEPETIEGTEGDDTLAGGAEDELILAGDGDDQVRGHAGDDTVYGGAGEDFVMGDNGQDHLHGEAGADTLVGGNGDDLLVGDSGDDVLVAEDGEDTVFAGDGHDFVDAGAGNDTIWMGEGADLLIDDTNGADDSSDGDDQVSGGGGNDEIRDFVGRDSLTGELGDDILDAVDRPGTDEPDTLFGGWGYDTVIGDDGDTMSGGGMADVITVFLDEADDQAVTITDFDADREVLNLQLDRDLFPDGEDDLSTETDPETGDVSLFLGDQRIAVLQAPSGEFLVENVVFLDA